MFLGFFNDIFDTLRKTIFFLSQMFRGRGKVTPQFLIIGTLGIVFNKGKGKDHRKLFHEDDWDAMIVLDACRYDYFEKVYNDYLDGQLKKARSPASGTAPWLQRVLDGNYPDIQFISTNPRVNSKGVDVLGYNAIEHFPSRNIVDVWDFGWDDELNTVHPKEVVKALKEHGDPSKRHLIWFMQPHGPWIGEPGLALSSTRPLEGHDEAIVPMLRSGEVSVEELKEMYESNLRLVMEYVVEAIDLFGKDKKIVVTSDHGELLGEYGSFLHFTYFTVPELREVPYFVVNGVKK